MPPDLFDHDDEEEDARQPPRQVLIATGALRDDTVRATDERHLRAPDHPELLLGSSILKLADPGKSGQLVEAVAIAWDRILEGLEQDPQFLNKLPWRKLEELVAASYHKQGWTVTLTPRSGDGGVDVIAERSDIGSLRVFDQVKRYSASHVVTRDQVDAMLGLLHRSPDVSKGVITTSSRFAPGVFKEPRIVAHMPSRLELRDGAELAVLLRKLPRT